MMYSLAPILAFIVVITINWEILFKRNYQYRNKRAYIAYKTLIIAALAFFVIDGAWGFFNDLADKTFVKIDTGLFFLGCSILVFAWLRFVYTYTESKNIYSKILLSIGYLFIVAGIVLVILNYFNPILFDYEGITYSAKFGRYLYYTVMLGLYGSVSLYELILSFIDKHSRKAQHFAIFIATITMAVAILLQIAFYYLPMISCACLASCVIMHAFVVLAEKQRISNVAKEAEKREKLSKEKLVATKEMAFRDPLTGVKSKHAYVEFENGLDENIRNKTVEEFCLCLFDLNDLKVINDTYGHEMGDQYIIKSCQMINELLPECDIYRVGGDEFVTILTGEDYKNRYELIDKFNQIIDNNVDTLEPVIAVGFSDFMPNRDNTLRAVFNRADERMYARKRVLKKRKSAESDAPTVAHLSHTNSSSRADMYEMFYLSDSFSLIDMLNASNCDEILEVDMNTDTFKQIAHVDGKYFIPNIDVSFSQLVEYGAQHVVHPDDVGVFLDLMGMDGFFERLANSRIPNFNFAHFRYKLADGTYRYFEQCVITGKENGIPEHVFRLYITDINNIMSRQLGKISYEGSIVSVGRDAVTGLISGKEFFNKAQECIDNNKEVKTWALATIDIEHFKLFDEWFGREKGDHLLAQIGGVLADQEEKLGGVAGYFGQDDFVILVPYKEQIFKDMYDAIHNTIIKFGLTAGFLPAFGVSILEDNIALVDAFDRATIAASKAKGDIRNRICIYNSDMQFLTQHEYFILSDFMKALKNDEITFYLQPQVHIRTKNIVGAEALARWIKKDGTLVPPGEFVPVLEKYGFITDLDKVMWEKVCKWMKDWMSDGHPMVAISINVSRIDIFNLDIATHLHDLADKYNIPHNLLKIEITESAYAETTNTIDELVKKLRKDRFQVMMDDFGSGYSSLNMLSNLKLDAIKLDANFLHIKGADQEKGIHILESVINLTKTMALPLVVEGVETKQQCDFLEDLGVRYVQGYYFYKPMPIMEFESLASNKSNIDTRGFMLKANEQFRIREFLDKNIYSDTMLNSIIGSVAIYSWDGKEQVDIVRYNQQFYESVGVSDFEKKLDHIEQTVPEESRPTFFKAFKDSIDNKMSGSVVDMRFARIDGAFAFFRLHLFYLGKKEGRHRFYGSVVNNTEVENLKDIKELVAEYSKDNLILISKVDKKWHYTVISHGLSDVIGLSPSQLEKELNDGSFAKRVVPQKALADFMKEASALAKEKKEFSHEFIILDSHKKKRKLKLSFRPVNDETKNTEYILQCEMID